MNGQYNFLKNQKSQTKQQEQQLLEWEPAAPFFKLKRKQFFTYRLMETECLKAVCGCFQVCGCADRVHEEQGTGQVLQREARSTAAFSAPGLLPLETRPTHPQVPPASARKKCISFWAAARRGSFLW